MVRGPPIDIDFYEKSGDKTCLRLASAPSPVFRNVLYFHTTSLREFFIKGLLVYFPAGAGIWIAD